MTFSRLLLIDGARTCGLPVAARSTAPGPPADPGTAPNLLRVRESTNVAVGDVLFRNSAAWSLHVLASSGVTRPERQGDQRPDEPQHGRDRPGHVIRRDDRSVVHLHEGRRDLREGDAQQRPLRECAAVVRTNNLVSSRDAALKVGTESEAVSFSDIVFENNYVFDSGRAMSVVVRDGAT